MDEVVFEPRPPVAQIVDGDNVTLYASGAASTVTESDVEPVHVLFVSITLSVPEFAPQLTTCWLPDCEPSVLPVPETLNWYVLPAVCGVTAYDAEEFGQMIVDPDRVGVGGLTAMTVAVPFMRLVQPEPVALTVYP